MMDRDLQLAGAQAAVFDSVCGLARATNEVLKGPNRQRDHARIDTAKEIGVRYEALVFTVLPAALEYSPAMSEADLRAWAGRIMAVLS